MASRFLNRLARSLHREQPQVDHPPDSGSAGTIPGTGSLLQGRYRLEEEAGRGGMGIVYRAHDIPNDRRVAIKVINHGKVDARAAQQFSHEVEILRRLKHPNIVSVYETGTVLAGGREPFPYIVMELIHGAALDEVGSFTFARILEVGKQICQALQYAHSQGIIYRDLKPENVLIERRNFQYQVKLTDFGVAHPRGMAYLDTRNSVVGTLFYLAPELISGQSAGIPSDLYALGATLYEMITGRVPFSDFDHQTILTQHLDAPVVPPSQSREDVPPALEAVVLRLLAKDPGDRFASAQEVYEELEKISAAHAGLVTRGNLPSGSQVYVWHPQVIEEIASLLQENRLVTLPGGTRELALESGFRLADHFPDGVWLVELGTLVDPAQVLETVAGALHIVPNPNHSLSVALVEHIHEKRLLLLLDHCAHLRGACAQLVETLLGTCPDVYILATSSLPLHVSAERGYIPAS